MPENVENWWRRRQRSKGLDVPYEVGEYRAEWARFPVLVRQFHPDLNGFVMLTQIPPAAEVYLLWECEAGHRFVATPTEQRERPDASRRRSTWCPECSEAALGRPSQIRRALDAARVAPPGLPPRTRPNRSGPTRRSRPVEPGQLAPGTAFFSARAPVPASAVEADLRQRIAARLDLDLACNAVQVRRPFHDRLEVWPDIVMPDLRVAIEYDTTGRTSTEHVGGRETSDRQKDRRLREVGWEVIRIRTSKLQALGPYDVVCSALSDRVVERVLDRLAEIRGDLIVAAYSR